MFTKSKKILALLLAVMFCLSGIPSHMNVYAAESESDSETKYLLDVSVTGGGDIEIIGDFEITADNKLSVSPNAELQVETKANSGYELESVKLDGAVLTVNNNMVTFSMPEKNAVLETVFKQITTNPVPTPTQSPATPQGSGDTTSKHQLSVNVTGEGTWNIVGDVSLVSENNYSVEENTDVEVELSPAEGYWLSKITLDGFDLPLNEDGSTAYFTMPEEACELEIEFIKLGSVSGDPILTAGIKKYGYEMTGYELFKKDDFVPPSNIGASTFAIGNVGTNYGMYKVFRQPTLIPQLNSQYTTDDYSKIIQVNENGVLKTYTSYCIQYMVPLNSGQSMTERNLSVNQKNYIGYALAYGWQQGGTDYVDAPYQDGGNKIEYLVTQGVIWCCAANYFNTPTGEAIMDIIIENSLNPPHARNSYNTLKANILNAEKIPSFSANNANSAQTINLEWNATNRRYETTITDTNGILSNFNYSCNGINFSKSGNNLTIYTTNKYTSPVTASASRNVDGGSNSVVTWDAGNNEQDCVTYRKYTNTINSYIKLQTKETVGNISLTKKSSDTTLVSGNSNYSLQGAVYTVYNASGNKVGTITTDANGKGSLNNLAVGSYTVKETTASKGYMLDTNTHKVTVESGKTASVTSYETPIYGYIAINKKSSNTTMTNGNSNYSLKGAVYTVYSDKACTKAVTTITTDANGYGKTSVKLALGTYYVKETKASTGYDLDTQVYTTQVVSKSTNGYTYTHTSSETPKSVKVELVKTSSDTSITNGNSCYSLQGAVYGVYRDASCKNKVGTMTTDVNGKASLSGLAAGTYYVKEITAPKGYYLDGKTYPVTLLPGETKPVNVKDIPEYDPVVVVLKKYDADTGQAIPQRDGSLAGAEFTIKYYAYLNESETGKDNVTDPSTLGKTPVRTFVLKTNAYGLVNLSDEFKVSGDDFYKDAEGDAFFPRGTITIQETKAPNGYKLNDTVFVRQVIPGATQGVSTFNLPEIPEKATNITIYKKDFGTGTLISGTKFLLTKPDGKTETFTTDDAGKIYIPGLVEGNYTLKEIETVDGYKVDDQTLNFRVTSSHVVEFVGITPADGKQVDSTTIQYSVSNGDGTVTFLNKPSTYSLEINKFNDDGAKLDGAEFTVYEDNALTKKVGTSETKDGVLTISGLEIGKTYYFVETKAPQGYRLPLDENGNPIIHTIYAESAPVDGVFNFSIDGKDYTVANTTGPVCLKGTVADRIVSVSMTNEIMVKLPVTGSSATLMMVLVGGLLMAGSFVLTKGKREDLD